jgi:hypothetical protein
MSSLVEWIAAEADERASAENGLGGSEPGEREADGQSPSDPSPGSGWQELPVDNFPGRLPVRDEGQRAVNNYWDRDPDLWMYRKKTTALLRRYMRWSLEAGRVPSLLGRELFRARITANTATTFEARVIFLHDVERCLDRLASFDREIIARVVLQEHENRQAARILHCTSRTIERRLPEVLDELSEALLRAQLIEPLPETRKEQENTV